MKTNLKLIIKKVLALKCIAALCSLIWLHPLEAQLVNNTAFTGIRDITPFEFVQDMESGWNLGNSLDAEGEDETAWGNPPTTQLMINTVRLKGFKTLRVPVTWRFHMGSAPDYTIEKEWLDRVEEVANYGFNAGMYVIINIHHDDPWVVPTYAHEEEVADRLSKVWTQIATRFKDYGDYLIFETLNEPRHEDTPEEWTGGTAEGRDVLNTYHKACVDAIRSTGGNNASRFLMIAPYAASPAGVAWDDLLIPNNDEKTIVSIHNYHPFEFSLGNGTNWGSSSDKAAMDFEVERIQKKFLDNGKAVVLGEWGSNYNNNTEARIVHAGYYARALAKKGIAPVVWDNGNSGEFGLINRRSSTWWYSEIADSVAYTVRDVYGITDEIVVPEIPLSTEALSNHQFYNYALGENKGIGVRYTLDKTSQTSLNILSIDGKHVETLMPSNIQVAGDYQLEWRDIDTTIQNGIYLFVFITGGSKEVRRFHLLR
ncbi:MAG: glycoside hydrolase family 5 protein [Cyclobacteriaceae bacterium]